MIFYGVCIFSFWLLWNQFGKRNKNAILACIAVVLFLMMGLRHSSIGTDTGGYCKEYLNMQMVPIGQIFAENASFGQSNYLYFLLNKAVGIFFPESYTAFLLTVSAFISFAMYKFVKKFSTDYFFSFVMLFSLGYIFFFMTGIKQTLAMAAVLLGFVALSEDKKLRFVLWVIVAALFHNTAVIALLVLLLYKLKWKKLYILVVPVIVVLANVFKSTIVSFFAQYLVDTKYGMYGTYYESENNITGLLIQLACFAFVLILMWNERKTPDPQLRYLLVINVIGIFFQCLVSIIAEFFRISMYFSIVSVVLVPYAIERTTLINPKNKVVLKVIMLVIFLAYFVIANHDNTPLVPYLPFWSGPSFA